MWWKSVVNLSFFLSVATLRMRSNACDALARLCVRCVLCWSAFPLVPALRSTGSAAFGSAADRSAAGCPALFVGFIATMAGSDFSGPFIIGYGSSPSRCGPTTAPPFRSDPRSPSFRYDPFARDVALDPGRASAPRMAVPHMLPSSEQRLSAPAISDLSWLNPTPHAIAVYASQPLLPEATQHSLPSGRYSLLGPDFHRLDRTSLRLAHLFDDLVDRTRSDRPGNVMPTLLAHAARSHLIATIVAFARMHAQQTACRPYRRTNEWLLPQ